MKFTRNARMFRWQWDAAPFAGVFFLLLIFLLLGSSFVFTSGVRINLPESGRLPGRPDAYHPARPGLRGVSMKKLLTGLSAIALAALALLAAPIAAPGCAAQEAADAEPAAAEAARMAEEEAAREAERLAALELKAEAGEEVELEEGETLDDLKERMGKLKPKKAAIPADLLNNANSYDDKVALIRMIVSDNSGRVASVMRNMIDAQ